MDRIEDKALGQRFKLLSGDCLEQMKALPDSSIDMVLADLPYGTTQNKWDSVVPLDVLWEQLTRLSKPNAAMLFFGAEPFSSHLRMSNLKRYRYTWIWEKTKAGQFLNAKRKPLEAHELIDVFYERLPFYSPQMAVGKPYTKKAVTNGDGRCYGAFDRLGETAINEGLRYPRSVIKFSNPNNGSVHPTQKPVPLLEYLIRTYTREGETVLDPTMGSGSCGVACLSTGRRFIGIEREPEYMAVAAARIGKSDAPVMHCASTGADNTGGL